MVFISQVLHNIRYSKKGPHKFWKKRRILSLAGHFYGRRRRSYAFAIRGVKRSLYHATNHYRWRRHLLQTVWETRLNAACEELDTDFESMNKVLKEADVALDLEILQSLAIWEPRTFKGLAMLTKAKTEEQGLNSLKSPPKGVITRGML